MQTRIEVRVAEILGVCAAVLIGGLGVLLIGLLLAYACLMFLHEIVFAWRSIPW